MFNVAIILNIVNGVHFVYQNPRVKTVEQKKNKPPRNDAPVKQRSFVPDISIRVFRSMFMGSVTYLVIRWFFLSDGKVIDKMEEINEIRDLLTKALY